jgi:hypothetical protein
VSRVRFAIVALAAGLALAGEVRAQPELEIAVTDGGTPLSGIQISQFVDGIKTRRGATGSGGRATIPDGRFDFADGETVSVWVRRCEDGEVEVVLAAEGEDDPCVDDDAVAGEDCGCERIGAFLWGRGPVRIDTGTGSVTQDAAPTANGTPSHGGFGIGAAFDLRQMYNLEEVVGDAFGVSDASATSWAPGFQIFGQYSFAGIVALGLEAGYSRMDTETQLAAGVQTGELDYYEVGGTAAVGAPLDDGPIQPYAKVGYYHAWNHLDLLFGDSSEHRLHKTNRVGLGGGIDVRAGDRVCVRFEGLYNSTFEDGDADEHIRWKVGLMFHPIPHRSF